MNMFERRFAMVEGPEVRYERVTKEVSRNLGEYHKYSKKLDGLKNTDQWTEKLTQQMDSVLARYSPYMANLAAGAGVALDAATQYHYGVGDSAVAGAIMTGIGVFGVQAAELLKLVNRTAT